MKILYYTWGENSKEDILYTLDKIGYYLEHDELRREIAYNGWKKVQEQFAYEYVVTQILQVVGK